MALTTVNSGLLDSNAQYTGFKNRIINGGMVIDQRNAGAVLNTTSLSYFAYYSFVTDRWNALCSATSKYTAQQTPSATESGYATRVAAGFSNYLAATSSGTYAIGAGDYFAFGQRIEGFNTADLAWGTANAKTITISFLAYSSITGTFGGAVTNSAQNRSYPFSYTISSANTWTPVSVTIPGDTSGTWVGATNGYGIQLTFGFGVGSTYSAAAGSWTGSLCMSCTGATSVVGTNGATFYITGVQLEKGSTATSFDYRPYGTELALCQRYYEVCDALFMTSAWSSIYNTIWWKATKRTMPTLVSIPGGGSGGTFNPGFGGPNTSGAFQDVANSIASGGTVKASAEL